MKRRTMLLLAAVFLLFSACADLPPSRQKSAEYAFEIHFIDVGQGDAALILSGEQAILVDAGLEENSDSLVAYLQDYGVQRLDLLALTHPHADHMGGMARVLDTVEVDTFIMPDVTHTTAGFEKMLEAVDRSGCTAEYAGQGDVYEYEGLRISVLSPGENLPTLDLNNASLVLMIEAQGARTLMTGDAEQQTEAFLLENGLRPADILKVGHHGSVTSSGQGFLNRVKPQVAVISCGQGNSYGHPHQEVLKGLEAAGAYILRTDQHGTVVVGVEEGEIHVRQQRESVGS